MGACSRPSEYASNHHEGPQRFCRPGQLPWVASRVCEEHCGLSNTECEESTLDY
jgi:hypothetical protein